MRRPFSSALPQARFAFLGSFLICLAALSFQSPMSAKDIYVADSSAGTGDGTSAANATSSAWFNTVSNWGTGPQQIGPGDTVHLCGVIATQLNVNGSGTPGHVITILFEPNAKMSCAAGTLIECMSKNYLVFDGGANGIIENTDNGSPPLHNQVDATGIYAPQCSNLEVKNLTIQNLYVHTSVDDVQGESGAVYLNGFGNNISIHDCTFHDIHWALTLASNPGSTGVSIYRNQFYNCDHGIAGIGGSMGNPANVNIYHNTFGSTANWDTTANAFHHDGIHIFFDPGGLLSGVNIHGNLFCGNWGINNTAHIFIQGDFSQANPNAVSNLAIYNNIFIQDFGNGLNNGFINGNGPNWRVQNNTFFGSRVRNTTALFLGGTELNFTNNLVTSVTTFLNLNPGTTFAAGALNHNLYSDAREGGNTMFSLAGTGYNVFALWQSATGQEAASSLGPQTNMNRDGTLLPGSTAIGAGADLSASFTTDKNGLTRTTPWDIGAFKYVPPTTPSAPKNVRIIGQ